MSCGCVRALWPADPARRIAFDDIKTHPWFVQDLPPGAFEMNDKLQSATKDTQVQYTCKGQSTYMTYADRIIIGFYTCFSTANRPPIIGHGAFHTERIRQGRCTPCIVWTLANVCYRAARGVHVPKCLWFSGRLYVITAHACVHAMCSPWKGVNQWRTTTGSHVQSLHLLALYHNMSHPQVSSHT